MQKIKYIFWVNFKEFITFFLASFGTIWLFIEFLSAIFSVVKTWIETYNWIVLIITLLASIGFGIIRAWPFSQMSKKFKASNTEICIKVGDLFSQQNNIVVTSSDYFDTTIPQGAKVSLKSQMIDKFFSGNIQTLDNLIDKSLTDQGKSGTYNAFKNGKKYCYPVGTIAVVPTSQNKLFITILATLSFTNNIKQTSSDPDKLNIVLNELWKQIRIEGRMKEVSVPILGSGLSGINLSNLMIIESIILSYATHSKSSRISDKLTIIIPENKYDPKDFYEICRFLQAIQI
ncbi:macro domain-containing protein [Flavobacterium sp. N1719]|uniref:macro domain-containing protein n=1 Tax=Flavobacterium sp. N1719 TaxID=2885633 RepID=UPI0022234F33|nr:macro domain-containing protein [Flavobacterium sp. N1719]